MAGRVWIIGLMVGCMPFVACGARTLGESDEQARRGVATTNGGRGNAGPTGVAGRTGNQKPSPLDDGGPLGPCTGGFDVAENPTKPCNCLVDGVCFDTKRDACACICPRDSQANTCVSRQDCEPDSRTKVSCYAL